MTDRLLSFRFAVPGHHYFSIAAATEEEARRALDQIILENDEGFNADPTIPDTPECRPTLAAGPFVHCYFSDDPVVSLEDVDDEDEPNELDDADDTESTPEDRPC